MIFETMARRLGIAALLAATLLAGCGRDNPDSLVASAKEYLAKKDGKAAIIQLKNAIQINPNQAEARFLLGKALLEGGDAAGAESSLKKSLELNYPAEEVVPPLARARLKLGQYPALINEFGTLKLSSNDAMADVQTSIGQAYLAQGKLESAQAAFAAALSAKPDYAQAQLAQARLKAVGNDLSGALGIVDAVLAKSASDFEAWQLKGEIQLAQGQVDQAVADYREAIKAKPDYVPAHAATVFILLRQEKLDDAAKQLEALKQVAPKHPQTLYLQAMLAYQQKNFTVARAAIQEQLRVLPENMAGLQLAGAIDYELKSYGQAEANLVKVLRHAPGAMLARRVLLATYVRTGQTDKALEALQNVADKIDNDSGMLALAGQVYMQANDPKRAQEAFVKASHLDPGNSGKATSLALSHLAGGEADVAFSELERIAASDSGSTADLALIAGHMQRHEYDKAMSAVAALERKIPNDPLPHNLRGGILVAKHDIAAARAAFGRALALNPSYYPAAANLANLDLIDKKPEEARKRFEAVLAADPKSQQALLAIANLRAGNGGGAEEVAGLIGKAIAANPTESLPRLALISYYLRVKEVKKAVAAGQEALAALPDRAEILDATGQAQRQAGDTNQALATYNKLIAVQPNSPLPYLRIAEIQATAKNNDAALQSLEKALAIKPDLVDAQRGMVQLHVVAGRIPEALAVARQVQKQRPKDPLGYILEGEAHAAQKAWKDAAAIYRVGLKQTGAAELAVRLHAALVAAGSTDESDKLAASWVKDHPKDVVFRAFLAQAAMTRKDYAAAVRLYKAALDVQPDNVLLLNNLAWAAGQQNDPKAIDYAEKANQVAPNRPELMDTLGMLLVAMGDTARGLDLLQKAVDLAPTASAIRLNLAKALIKANQAAAARKQLNELTALGDKLPEQAEVAQLLKGL